MKKTTPTYLGVQRRYHDYKLLLEYSGKIEKEEGQRRKKEGERNFKQSKCGKKSHLENVSVECKEFL